MQSDEGAAAATGSRHIPEISSAHTGHIQTTSGTRAVNTAGTQ